MNLGGPSTVPWWQEYCNFWEMIICTLLDSQVTAKLKKGWFKYIKSCLEVPKVWIAILIPWIECREWTELTE